MNKAIETIYKRDQVERAIAALSGRVSDGQQRPEAGLRADLKRLIDRDRLEGIQTRKGPRSRYAFHDGSPPGKGVDQTYGFAAAFSLFAAERLLRAGLTQQRVVMRMRAARPMLDSKVSEILLASFPKAHASGTRYKPDSDAMIFWMTIDGPAADLELWPEEFCTADEARSVLIASSMHCRPIVSIELVAAVIGLKYWLDRIPVRKRGRS